ncbi:MAG: J domain-containing protein [Salibacteraceae bacterium]
MRQTFLDVFGLPSDASEVDIKKKYRELVLKVHPDVNPSPNAEVQFRLIQKAYEYLMNEDQQVDMLYRQFNNSKATKPRKSDQLFNEDEKRAEMKERAQYYSEIAHKEARRVEESVFQLLTNHWFWHVVRGLAVCSIVFGCLIFTDFIIPNQVKMDRVRNMVHSHIFQKNTIYFTTEEKVDVPDNIYRGIEKGDSLGLEYSSILREFVGYRIKRSNETETGLVKEINLFTLFPLVPLWFLIPGILFFYQENKVRFYLLYFVTCFAYPGIMLHYILRENKLIFISEYLSNLF